MGKRIQGQVLGGGSMKSETFKIKQQPEIYVKQFPYVGDNGIYVPLEEYAPE